jgi:hypothetical protein
VKWLSTSGATEFLCGFLTAGTSNGALYDPPLLNATSTKRLMFSLQYHLASLRYSVSQEINMSDKYDVLVMDEITRQVRCFGNNSGKSIIFSLIALMPAANRKVAVVTIETTNQDRLCIASNDYLAQLAHCLRICCIKCKPIRLQCISSHKCADF